MNSEVSGRVWEIDFLRGVALVLMIIFHFLFDLKEFYDYPVPYNSGVYYYIGKTAGTLFILMAAVSCFLSRSNFRRGIKLLGLAMAITLVTHLYDPDFGIKYGILHFLGTSIILFPVFRLVDKYILVILGTMIISLGQYLGTMSPANNYFFLFNLTNSGWISADYYPFFPWFGVFLYGIALGKFFYRNKVSLFGHRPRWDFMSYLGSRTLLVYLVHQPLLILIIGIYVKLTQ